MKFFSRYDRLLAMILVFCMLAGTSACKRKKTTSQDISVTETTEAPTSETESETTTESTTESTAEATTSEPLVLPTLVPGQSDLPSFPETSESETEPSETTSAPAETTPAPVDPTKAHDKPKPTKAPKETTKKPDPTKAPATSTPTLTPTSAPKAKDPGLRKNTAISSAKAAVQDKCGSHEGFEFNETVMTNEQARAKYCSDNQYFYGHESISGTFIPLEAAAMFIGYVFEDGTEYYEYDAHGSTKSFDNFYDCLYSLSSFLVTEHTTKLSSDSANKYYGIGFAGYKDSWSEQEYGIITYQYYLYIGADDDIDRNARGY